MAEAAILDFVVGAGVTLMAMSLAFKESPLSRIAEHLALGVLGGYATVASLKFAVDTATKQLATSEYLALVPSVLVGALLYFQLVRPYRWVTGIPTGLLAGTMLGVLTTKAVRPEIIDLQIHW